MTVSIVHTVGQRVDVRAGDLLLCSYVYRPDTPARESPRPYLHPIRTLGGNLVTVFRPHDHVWHKGLSMTAAHLSGENFWGGPTYVRDRGYVQLDNNGVMRHRSWAELGCDAHGATMVEQLDWLTATGAAWLDERRGLRVTDVDGEAGCWALDVDLALRNVSGRTLVFGSPTTQGRDKAGYGGLFWRGPRSFTGGELLAGGGLEGEETVNGAAAAWLAFRGRHDGNDARSTVAFVDHPGNPRHPTTWFARSTPYACASFAFSYDRELAMEPDKELTLRYRVAFVDGAWSRDRLDAYADAWTARAG